MSRVFSVIIPTLNEEKYLPHLLLDLKNQSYKDFEVIVVDGNSEDSTVKCAEKYEKDLNISCLVTKTRNVAHQRNLGAKQAQGEFLVYIDADNRIGSKFLAQSLKFLSKSKCLLMIPSAQLDTKSQELQLVGIFWNIFVDSSLKTPKPYSNGGNFIIDRYIYNKIGGMNEALFISEDHDILRKAYSWGISAKFNKNVKVKLSVRRLEKENGWKLFYKYFIAIVYVFMGKNVDTKKFTYEMGGHAYSSKKKKNVKLSHETYSLFRKQLKSMKLYFKDLLETS